MTVWIDDEGAEEVLKNLAATVIHELGEKIGAAAGEDAVVEFYTTDRAAAAISVPVEQQAKDGALTRAAGAYGLEIRAK